MNDETREQAFSYKEYVEKYSRPSPERDDEGFAEKAAKETLEIFENALKVKP